MTWLVIYGVILIAQVAVFLHARHAMRQQEVRIRKQWATEHATTEAASACVVCGQQ